MLGLTATIFQFESDDSADERAKHSKTEVAKLGDYEDAVLRALADLHAAAPATANLECT